MTPPLSVQSGEPARQLRALPLPAFNKETGEVDTEVDCAGCQEKGDENEGLKGKVSAQAGEITKLRRQLARMQGVEPGNEQVREVLEYARDQLREGAKIIPASPAWKKAKERLEEVDIEGKKVWTVEDLKLAVDGVKKSDWHMGRDPRTKGKSYKNPETIFRDAGTVRGHMAAARAKPPKQAPPQRTSDKPIVQLEPFDEMVRTLRVEFGADTVEFLLDGLRTEEAWGPCPSCGGAPLYHQLRIKRRGEHARPDVACINGCLPSMIWDEFRRLYRAHREAA